VLLVEGNPLEDLNLAANQNNFKIIMKDGRLYKNMLNG